MTRVGTHQCWTTWGPQPVIDSPARLRRYTRLRQRMGELRYRRLRYSMANAQNTLTLHRLVRELGWIQKQLQEAP